LTRGVASSARVKKWGYDGEPLELRGMTMGIIGLGGIGRETARRAKSMDMKVLAVDAEPMFAEKFAMVEQVRLVGDGLMELLKRSDVVVSAAPHTPQSRGMLGAEQFAAMKKGAYFINVSRGKLVRTDALIEALKSGHLAGAGLDVTDPEPLPEGHPLWDVPNTIITPHIAGRSQLGYERVEAVFAENVRRFVNEQPMLNLVDKAKGY
jgi:phosphoglycerate dehydrogenase-like enzyme